MKLIKELAKQLKKAAKEADVQKCIELSERITKVMETYKRSC